MVVRGRAGGADDAAVILPGCSARSRSDRDGVGAVLGVVDGGSTCVELGEVLDQAFAFDVDVGDDPIQPTWEPPRFSSNNDIAAGTITMRTTVASSSTATESPTPNILMIGLSPNRRPCAHSSPTSPGTARPTAARLVVGPSTGWRSRHLKSAGHDQRHNLQVRTKESVKGALTSGPFHRLRRLGRCRAGEEGQSTVAVLAPTYLRTGERDHHPVRGVELAAPDRGHQRPHPRGMGQRPGSRRMTSGGSSPPKPSPSVCRSTSPPSFSATRVSTPPRVTSPSTTLT